MIAESSTGGLISAALLAVPGASAYFLGGTVVYTQDAGGRSSRSRPRALGMRASTEPYALLLAPTARERLGATWALARPAPPARPATATATRPATPASGRGPGERAITLETGSGDRVANMRAFAAAALDLLAETLAAQGGTAG